MNIRENIHEAYLDWINNFLTVAKFASYYELTIEQANNLIELGRSIHEGHHPDA